MTLRFSTPLADALAAWRRDRALLLPLTGLTLFVPQLALLLLAPAMPQRPAETTEAALAQWNAAVAAWMAGAGGYFVAGVLLSFIAALTVTALYLDPHRPALGGALMRGAALLFRFIIAMLAIALPAGILLMAAMATYWLLIVAVPAICFVMARSWLVAPVLVAEAPVSAIRALRRSWTLTRGHGWLLTGLYGAIWLTAQSGAGIFETIAEVGASGEGVNPVVEFVGSALAAGVAAAGGLTIALVAVALYRRLANRGT